MIEFNIFLSWSFFYFYLYRIYKYQNFFLYFNASILIFFLFLIYYSIPIIFNIYFYENYINGYRLEILKPTYDENLKISFHILSGSSGFLIGSLLYKFKIFSNIQYRISKNYLLFLIFLLLFLYFIFYIFRIQFDTSNIIFRTDGYLFAQSLSFLNGAINKFLSTAIFILKVIILFKFVEYFREKKFYIWFIVFILIIYNYFTFEIYDQRSEYYTYIVLFIISYSMFVKEISIKKIFLLFLLTLYTFIAWSLAREGQPINVISNLGEFDHIYANSIDLIRSENFNLMLSTKLYDFYSFIPSVFLPFEKNTLIKWYAENYHAEGHRLGHGFGFGIIAESITGFGTFETFFKTFILTIFFNYFYTKYFFSRKKYLEIFYIILFIFSPLSIRVTAFYFLSTLIQFGIILSIIIYFFQYTSKPKIR